ncbi:MAG: UDP-N-acetylmuramate dehydrogenase [Bacteroidetes bacterium]|jgi:UDP-N-acetylmuramate dehydrogenase|nr:UDP-N-acetylmuramate dehydrogenase [Bacteroidota bacterium]
MKKEFNKNLTQLNTFGMSVTAKEFVTVTSPDQIKDMVKQSIFKSPFFILGGGSNVLFTDDFDGIVIKNEIKGIRLVKETEKDVTIHVGAGENWHDTVLYTIDHNWGGIENLSLIPGCVGASPIQNIGAYGVELKDVLTHVHFIDLQSGEEHSLSNVDCKFGYRNSVFKQVLKNKVFITGVELRLSKQHTLHLTYGAIMDQLSSVGIDNPTIKDVSDAVIEIRQSKLPDPNALGNSGSFFKNPVISKTLFDEIKKSNPDLRCYPSDELNVKIAAGWLIEKCGWKGKKIGNTGSHAKQALVLVNYGGATGLEVLTLANKIIKSVEEAFNVTLEPEVNIV